MLFRSSPPQTPASSSPRNLRDIAGAPTPLDGETLSDPYRMAAEARRETEAANEANRRAAEGMESIECDIRSGKAIAPNRLLRIVFMGSEEERGAVRQLLATPEAEARNQDLLLPHMRALLAGSHEAEDYYRRHRITIQENLPEWCRTPFFDVNDPLSFRRINLLTPQVKEYVDKRLNRYGFDTWVKSEFGTAILPPLDEHTLSGKLRLADCRTFTLTPLPVREILEKMERLAVSQLPSDPEDLFDRMRYEVEERDISPMSPTIVGTLYRKAIGDELTALSAAFLLEDALLSLGLPLNNAARLRVWRQTASDPFTQLPRHPIVTTGPRLLDALREELVAQSDDIDEEVIAERFSGLFIDDNSRRKLLGSLARTEIGLDRRPTSTERSAGEPHHTAPIAEPESPRRNLRLLLRAAIESYCDHTSPADIDTLARRLAKLCVNSDETFTFAIRSLEQGEDPAVLIEKLRGARRALTRASDEHSQEEDEIDTREGDTLDEKVATESRVEYVITPEAHRRMRDGRLRHAAMNLLDTYAETPERVDCRKIAATANIWEMKTNRPVPVRVYYSHLGAGKVAVLLVGDKKTQERDIPRLRELRAGVARDQ